MLKKIYKIAFLVTIPFLLGGCGKDESHFESMTFNQTPIDLANPVTNEDDFVEDLKVIETDVSLYYDRYVPDEAAYIPLQMANTSYSNDLNGNQIPNSLFHEDFSRENLRNIDFLIDEYHIAKRNELNYKYNWKNEDEDSKDFFSLTKNVSVLGKYKEKESTIFDDLVISSDYNFSNCNTPEVFSVSLYNLKNTEDGIIKSKGILENMLPEDMSAFLLNSPNEVDSDTLQSFNGSLGTEDKNSTYTFYREFKTPLKDSSDMVSSRFDVRFVDSYSQKQMQGKVIINNQKETFSSVNNGVDWGIFAKNKLFTVDNSLGCFSRLYKGSLPPSIYKFVNSYKDYENLKYTVFDETTNLNPADVIVPYQEYAYDTHITIKSKDTTDKTKADFETGETSIKYNYKKSNNEFSSMSLIIQDILFVPSDSSMDGVESIIENRIQSWISPIDLSETNIAFNEETVIYEDINNLRCKISLKPTVYEKGSYTFFQVDISIESDDIYGIVETDIVSVHDEIEYDVEGNVIQKENEPSVSEIIMEEEIEEEIESDSSSIKEIILDNYNLEWNTEDIEKNIYIRVENDYCVKIDVPEDIKTVIDGIQNNEERYLFKYDTSIIDEIYTFEEMVDSTNGKDIDFVNKDIKIAKLISYEKIDGNDNIEEILEENGSNISGGNLSDLF